MRCYICDAYLDTIDFERDGVSVAPCLRCRVEVEDSLTDFNSLRYEGLRDDFDLEDFDDEYE